jgi:hypothetical protein
LKGLENVHPEELQKIKSNKETLTLSRIIWPHDMVDHPSHGITTWPGCGSPAAIATFLDSLGLVQMDAAGVLLSRLNDISPFIGKLTDLELGSIVVKKDNPDLKHTLAMALDKWIQARGRKTVPIGGPIPHDFHLDDSCSGKITNVLKAVQPGKPLSLFACRATPSDDVLGDQSKPEHSKYQHRFRLSQRDEIYSVNLFYHGSDLRGEPITKPSKQTDEFGMRFEGDPTQGDFHSFGKARAYVLGPNSGVWEFSTLWSEIGYFSAPLLQNEVSGRLRATGQTRLVDKRLPLIPFR